MREILVRGKSVYRDNGWIQGSLIIYKHKFYILDEDLLFYCDSSNEKCFNGAIEVIPETVGQWTGLYDKNGKRIFDGNIISYLHFHTIHGTPFKLIYEIDLDLSRELGDGAYYLYPEDKNLDLGYAPSDLFLFSLRDESKYIEIIGNKFENPELLKGE